MILVNTLGHPSGRDTTSEMVKEILLIAVTERFTTVGNDFGANTTLDGLSDCGRKLFVRLQ